MSNITAEKLREMKCGLFAERDTPNEAVDYALEMLKRDGVSGMVATTAVYVVVNSLLEAFAKQLED